MIDSFLVISNNQHLSLVTVAYTKFIVGDYYVDLGAFSLDQWGTGRTTRPGWWIPEQLTLTWKLGPTVPVTNSEAESHSSFSLWGTNDLAEIKVEPDESKAYRYLISGNCMGPWPKAYPNASLLQIGLPRLFHRYLFIEYGLYNIHYVYFDVWLGFGHQFLLPAKYPVYPGNAD